MKAQLQPTRKQNWERDPLGHGSPTVIGKEIPGHNHGHDDGAAYPFQPFLPLLLPHFRGRFQTWNLRHNPRNGKASKILFAVNPIIQSLYAGGSHKTDDQSTYQAEETELEPVRPIRLGRQTRGIQDAKLLALLAFLKVRSKLGLIFFR